MTLVSFLSGAIELGATLTLRHDGQHFVAEITAPGGIPFRATHAQLGPALRAVAADVAAAAYRNAAVTGKEGDR